MHRRTRDPHEQPETLEPGVAVVVRNRFHRTWSAGFEVAARTATGYRIRRQSDRYVLPAEFSPSELRPI
jgi:hypothetical protein